MPVIVQLDSPSAQRKSWLDRSLSLFTEVRAGEGGTALLLASNLFCLFALYYVLKPVRESLGFLIQLFLVSRIFKYIGVRGALFILPLVALASYTSLAFFPALAIVRMTKTIENSTDYSIQTTARHALFLPTSREAKYKAKQAIDSFFWRAGDLLQAVIVFIGVRLAFDIRAYALVNLVLVAMWLAFVFAIAREHRNLTAVEVARDAA